MTTTSANIRNTMLRGVQTLTPSKLAHVKYTLHRETLALEEWAELNPTAAFRRVSIRDTGRWEPPTVSDQTQEWTWATFELRVSYPNDYRYGAGLDLSQDDVMESDYQLIERTIGVNGYQTLAIDGTVSEVSPEREYRQACGYLLMHLRVGFWRAVS